MFIEAIFRILIHDRNVWKPNERCCEVDSESYTSHTQISVQDVKCSSAMKPEAVGLFFLVHDTQPEHLLPVILRDTLQ